MKAVLLFLTLLFPVSLSFGQIKLYPKVGVVVSSQSLKFGEDEDRTNKEIQNKAGYVAGIGFETKAYKSLSVSAAFNYTQLGYTDKDKRSNWLQKREYSLDYLTVPVALKYNILHKDLSTFYLSFGGYSGVFLDGKLTTETESPQEVPNYYSSEDEIRVNDRHTFDRFDWGVNFGCGIEFQFLRSDFILDANYALGLANVQEQYESGIMKVGSTRWYYDLGTLGGNGKNKFFSLSLGYVLPFRIGK